MGEVKEMGKVKEINNPQMLPQKPFTGSFFSQCGWKEASSNTEAVAEWGLQEIQIWVQIGLKLSNKNSLLKR